MQQFSHLQGTDENLWLVLSSALGKLGATLHYIASMSKSIISLSQLLVMPTSLLNPQSWASHHGPFESIWAWSKSKPFNKGTKQLSGLAAQMTNCLWCMRCCCFYPSINKGFPLWTLLARPLYIFLASAFCFMLYTVKIRAMFFLTTCARTETFSNKTVDWTRIISPLNSEPSNL